MNVRMDAATALICSGVSLSRKDFMSWPLPFLSTVTIESCERFAKKAASKVTIFGNFVCIAFGGTPRTP